MHYTVWPVTTYSEMEKICDSEFRDTEASLSHAPSPKCCSDIYPWHTMHMYTHLEVLGPRTKP